MSAGHLERLVRKIASTSSLNSDEERALTELPASIVKLRAQQDFVREGDQPSRCALLVDGFAVSSKVVADAKRQITSFYVPGDIPDLQSLHLQVMDMTVTTLVPSTVAFIPHDAMRTLCINYPRLCFALWRTTLVDAAIYREWVANMGQRQAPSRAAHVLCELVTRLRAVGLAHDFVVDFPFTQVELADVLGLSPVHVNRVLMELRGAHLIELKGKRLLITDWKGLRAFGDFDPIFLHFKEDVEQASLSRNGVPPPGV